MSEKERVLTSDDVEKLRDPSELPHHWALRKEFLLKHFSSYPQDRLVSLSHIFVNTVCLGLTYSDDIMNLIKDLGSGIDRSVLEATNVESESTSRNRVEQNLYRAYEGPTRSAEPYQPRDSDHYQNSRSFNHYSPRGFNQYPSNTSRGSGRGFYQNQPRGFHQNQPRGFHQNQSRGFDDYPSRGSNQFQPRRPFTRSRGPHSYDRNDRFRRE